MMTFLFTAPREEIEKAVEEFIVIGGKKGYILGSDCSLDGSLDNQRLRWVVEKARQI